MECGPGRGLEVERGRPAGVRVRERGERQGLQACPVFYDLSYQGRLHLWKT